MTSLPDINKPNEDNSKLGAASTSVADSNKLIHDFCEKHVDPTYSAYDREKYVKEAETAFNQLILEARATAYEDCGSKGGSGTVVRAYAKSRAYGLRQKTDEKTYSETWTKETWTRD